MAFLYIASKEAQIDIKQPRFKVPAAKISTLEEILSRGQSSVSVSAGSGTGSKKASKDRPPKYRRLLNFKGKYPLPVFYDPLEDEINTAHSNPALPNAVLLLSRKLIENLVYNLLENRFSGIQTDLYYNTGQMRAHDFSVLLDNLKKHKSDFASDQQESIERFLKIMDETKFRREANSATHKVMEYLDSMREIQKFKIPHMAQILLHLIDQLREPEPKFLNVIKAEQLDNGLLISLMNAGNEPVTLTDYAVEGLPKQPFGRKLVIQKGETKRFALETPEGFRFQKGESVQFRLWLEGGRELPFQHAVRIR